MVQIKAATVEEYLEKIPAESRQTISALRKLIVKNLPKGYRESINFGMISYEIPLEKFPNTYNGLPLMYMALAAQKNHNALYLMCVYGSPKQAQWLKEEFKKAGKKLNMGKSCLRFKTLNDLPLDAIAKVVASVTPEQYMARCKGIRCKHLKKK